MRGEDGEQTLRCRDPRQRRRPVRRRHRANAGRAAPGRERISSENRVRRSPRCHRSQMPFSIDLDGQTIDWTGEERQLLEQDPATAWLARPMPGGIHCRPEGGDHGKWIKLGWAYNRQPSEPQAGSPDGSQFSGYRSKRREPAESAPQAVLRPAAAANHALRRLLHHDQGELAVDRADEDQGSLHRRRAFRFRNDGGLCNGRALRRVGFWAQRGPNLPSDSACHATTTRTSCGSCRTAREPVRFSAAVS